MYMYICLSLYCFKGSRAPCTFYNNTLFKNILFEYVGLQGPLYILQQNTFQTCIVWICRAPGPPLQFKPIHFSKVYCLNMLRLQGPLYILKQYTFETRIALICKAPGLLYILRQYTFQKCIVWICKALGLQGLYVLGQYTFQMYIALMCKAPRPPLHFKAMHFSKVNCFDM